VTGESEAQEFKRKKRVADMLVTAHNILGERYRRISLVVDISLMSASFVILLFSVVELVAPTTVTEVVGILARPTIVAAAALIFVFAIVEWRVSWKSKAEAHFQAAKTFSSIKNEIGVLLSKGLSGNELVAAKLEDRYEKLGLSCVQVSHNKFLKLKRKHLQKVALSRMLGKQPFAIVFLVRARLAFKHTSKGWAGLD